MPINTPHPEYLKYVEDWRKVRDAIEGESAIRRDITYYLPIPPGHATSTEVLMSGKRVAHTRYSFYASFAEFPEIVSPTLNGILGLIHEKRPVVELPEDMRYLIDSVTPDGEDLHDFWERCTREILTTGRFVTLGEIFDDRPYLCPYLAESLINWQMYPKSIGGMERLVVLREMKLVPDPEDPYVYKVAEIYRRLSLENGVYTVSVYQEIDGKMQALVLDQFEDEETGKIVDQRELLPVYLGRPMTRIPITVINALGLGHEYGPIPMLPMTRRSLSIFRKSADYNRSMYIKGDPQCVLFGVMADDAPTEIGGSAIWCFENPEGKAQYLDIDGQGIPLMRQSINDEFDRFADEVGMLLEGSVTGYESGEALRRRQAVRQVTVKSVVINSAEGIQSALRSLGRMKGKSEEELKKIKFTPNLDFTEPMMTGQELREFVTSKRLGAPLSEKTLHELMRRRQVTQRDYEEERRLLDKEPPLQGGSATTVSGTMAETTNVPGADRPEGGDRRSPPGQERRRGGQSPRG